MRLFCCGNVFWPVDPIDPIREDAVMAKGREEDSKEELQKSFKIEQESTVEEDKKAIFFYKRTGRLDHGKR